MARWQERCRCHCRLQWFPDVFMMTTRTILPEWMRKFMKVFTRATTIPLWLLYRGERALIRCHLLLIRVFLYYTKLATLILTLTLTVVSHIFFLFKAPYQKFVWTIIQLVNITNLFPFEVVQNIVNFVHDGETRIAQILYPQTSLLASIYVTFELCFIEKVNCVT